MKITVGITGGIGSGKSVIARVLRNRGLPVFDCDVEAKFLMDNSSEIKERLRKEINPSCVNVSGAIDRSILSKIVFKDTTKLKLLNEIVHGEVKRCFINWRSSQTQQLIFIETAIPISSHFEMLMDKIWLVEAPHEVRIKRVAARNSMSISDIEKRIKAQQHEFDGLDATKKRILNNDGEESLLLRINELFNEL